MPMRFSLLALLILGTPELAFASTIPMERALFDPGQLQSLIVDMASTSGGIHVYSSAVSTGSSSASVNVTNVVTSGSEGGSVHTNVRTESNGVVREETIDKTFAPGESINVSVATSSPGSSLRAKVHVGSGSEGPFLPAASSGTAMFETSTATVTVPWLAPIRSDVLLRFLNTLFSAFRFW